ncbi:CRISPR-associated endonuclease Cas1 [Salipiger abyssi]|uniref:CRISPR-associated endonuclease Cas1 n=1 Tax=Salipiger abyssi TaxID=1250539 RepID=UPI001A8F3621|nr:CRISPR-associated endonuclease Cas1 [Salipiger abyssi]MBN9887850.1 CRISPR-associated endonuclease Cas1 [Salipiger abyssi]
MSPTIFHRMTSFGALSLAWDRVRRNAGCSGGDGQTIDQFAQIATDSLRVLSGKLRNGHYRPRRLRHHLVPKPDGSQRPLAIPSISDRIVQTACAQALGPLLEPEFHPDSYGYRPGRSVQMAVDRIGALRRAGHVWVVEADIDRAFEHVPHAPILDALDRLIGEPQITDLIAHWFEHAAQDRGTPGRGLPQGSPLSPLLFNLFLDGLDERFDTPDIRIVRFADDFLLLATSETAARAGLSRAKLWLAQHGLDLNEEGSRVVTFDRGFAFLGKLFVRSLTLPEPDEDADPETAAILRELAEEDAEEAAAEAAGHDSGARILYMMEPGRRLAVTGRSFSVRGKNDAELLRLPHARVDRIEIGPAIELDAELMRHVLATGTELALVRGDGETLGQLSPPVAARASLHLAQARVCLDPALATDLARRIVDARLRNQRARLHVLNRTPRRDDVVRASKEIGRILRKLPQAEDVAALRGHEGRAAAVYWPALGALCEGEPQPFRRSRPASTPLNAAINYLSAMLERDMRSAVLAAGLHPGFGVLHSPADRHDACVWDLQEGFRAALGEGLAVGLFSRNRLRAVTDRLGPPA